MMKKQTKIIAAVAAAVILFAAFAYIFTYAICGFMNNGGFEVHIFPEEFSEDYTEHTETFALDKNTDYRFEISASCETGTAEVAILYPDGSKRTFEVEQGGEHREIIEIPRSKSGNLDITVKFDRDTRCDLSGEILTRKHWLLV